MSAYRARDEYNQPFQQPYQFFHARAHGTQFEIQQTPDGPSSNPYASYQQVSAPQLLQYPQRPSLSSHSSSSTSVGEDGIKPSLPSISNLLGIAAGTIAQSQAQQLQHQQQHQQLQQQQQQIQIQQAQQHHALQTVQQRQRPSYPIPELASSQRTAIPPTPPLRNESVVDRTNSPSTISTGSSISGPPYFVGSSLNNLEPHEQRAAAAQFLKQRQSISSQPNTSSYGATPYATSLYSASPGALSTGSFYSPNETFSAASSMPGLYQQRPLPSNFPPPAPPVNSTLPSGLPMANPWEHHHYISASSQATFPQSQDRYLCATCNKAFSRPSSLKIHSHSHTGEKPFKCPHAGCGKAFSVRSNMKRHERGCHTGLGTGAEP